MDITTAQLAALENGELTIPSKLGGIVFVIEHIDVTDSLIFFHLRALNFGPKDKAISRTVVIPSIELETMKGMSGETFSCSHTLATLQKEIAKDADKLLSISQTNNHFDL